ncbi:hypothetical protein Tco_0456478 [Tanacetum coccineum]
MEAKSKLMRNKEGKSVDPSHFVARLRKALNAVKRIFRYLKGTVTSVSFRLVSWNLKGSNTLRISTRKLNILLCPVLSSSPMDEITLTDYGLDSIKFQYLLLDDALVAPADDLRLGNAMYYPRFTKLVVNFVMEKDPSIPRRNKVNWHYARDDPMFTTINVISRNEATQLYGAILPVALTNEDIRNSESYKEYYARASGTIPPKTKGSKKKANTDIITQQKPPTTPKEKNGSGADKGTSVIPGVPDAPDYDSEDDISWKSSDDDQEMSKLKMMKMQYPRSSNPGTEDTHVTLTPVNPNGQQHSSQQLKPTFSLINSVTASWRPSFNTNHSPPTPLKALKTTSRNSDKQINMLKRSPPFSLLINTSESNCRKHGHAVQLKKNHKETIKKEVSKVIPKIKKLVTDQLESEVLVRSSKEANTSHAIAAKLLELELKKILIDKMEANNSINRSDIQRQLYKALVDAYEADKILLDTYGDTVTIKRPRDGADDDQEPSAGTDRGSKRRRSGKEPASTSAPSETGEERQPRQQERLPHLAYRFETVVHDEQAEEEVQHLPDWFQQPTRLPSPDHAWNKSVPAVHESVQPWLSNLAQQDPRESFDELTDSTLTSPLFLTELEYFCKEVYKATTERLDWINLEGRQYPHDLRQPLPLVPNSQDLVANQWWSPNDSQEYDKIRPLGNLAMGKKRRQFYAFATSKESARDVYSKRRIIVFQEGRLPQTKVQDIEECCFSRVARKMTNLIVEEQELNSQSLTRYQIQSESQDAYTHTPIQEDSNYENRRQEEQIDAIDEHNKFYDGTLDDVRFEGGVVKCVVFQNIRVNSFDNEDGKPCFEPTFKQAHGRNRKSQGGQSFKMAKRLYLIDDPQDAQDALSQNTRFKEQAQSKSHRSLQQFTRKRKSRVRAKD